MNKHQKHTRLSRPEWAMFNRNELAIFGLSCRDVREFVKQINSSLQTKYKLAFADASHQLKNDEALLPDLPTLIESPGKSDYLDFDYSKPAANFQNRVIFSNYDLVMVNGNHFNAGAQIAVINPEKPLDKKLDKLNNVKLILLAEGVDFIPDTFLNSLTQDFSPAVLKWNDHTGISTFIDDYLSRRKPVLNGLVLAGGKSLRMQSDKGSLNYFGKSQRKHVNRLLENHCHKTYVSYSKEADVDYTEQLSVIIDTFADLGPFGGILSAFREDPDAAWLTVACDLPYLTEDTIDFLVRNRNPQKMATCFIDSDSQFPEPLITIWEPRAYMVMLHFLSLGYSCPRKVLINSDIEVLQAPKIAELQNVNTPEERQAAIKYLSKLV